MISKTMYTKVYFAVYIISVLLDNLVYGAALYVEVDYTTTISCNPDTNAINDGFHLVKNGISLVNHANSIVTTNANEEKYHVNAANYEIEIRNVDLSDNGTYSCSITTQGFVVVMYFTDLLVYAKPENGMITTDIHEVEERTAADVTCRVSLVAPLNRLKVSLRSGTQVIEGQTEPTDDMNGAVVVFPSIMFQREYNFEKLQCIFHYKLPPGNTVDEYPSNELNVVVRYCNQTDIEGNSDSMQWYVGNEATITCIANCFPLRQLALYVGSVENSPPISEQNDVKRMEARVTLRKEHNKRYFICTADGVEVGQIFYDIQFQASTISIEKTTQDSSAVFMCTTDESNPVAVVKWNLTGSSNGFDQNDIVNSEEIGCCNAKKRVSTLTLSNPSRTLNGQQVICVVHNTDTKDSATVDVQFKATTLSITKSPLALVQAGNQVEFTCETDEANPTAKIIWSVDGNDNIQDIGQIINDELEGTCCHSKKKKVPTATLR